MPIGRGSIMMQGVGTGSYQQSEEDDGTIAELRRIREEAMRAARERMEQRREELERRHQEINTQSYIQSIQPRVYGYGPGLSAIPPGGPLTRPGTMEEFNTNVEAMLARERRNKGLDSLWALGARRYPVTPGTPPAPDSDSIEAKRREIEAKRREMDAYVLRHSERPRHGDAGGRLDPLGPGIQRYKITNPTSWGEAPPIRGGPYMEYDRERGVVRLIGPERVGWVDGKLTLLPRTPDQIAQYRNTLRAGIERRNRRLAATLISRGGAVPEYGSGPEGRVTEGDLIRELRRLPSRPSIPRPSSSETASSMMERVRANAQAVGASPQELMSALIESQLMADPDGDRARKNFQDAGISEADLFAEANRLRSQIESGTLSDEDLRQAEMLLRRIYSVLTTRQRPPSGW